MLTDGEAARYAFAESLAAELDVDLEPEFLEYSDRILARLYLLGFVVRPLPEDDE